MSRITPGPWRWTAGDKEIDIETYKSPGYYDNPQLLGANDEHVVGCGEYTVVHNTANARAIAALPEAIERLEWVAANLENVATHPEEYPNLHSEAMKVRRILARIEGE